MSSTPVFEDGSIRPFKSTYQEFSRQNVTLTQVELDTHNKGIGVHSSPGTNSGSSGYNASSNFDALQDCKIRYADINAQVIGFETLQLPTNQYGKSLSSPLQSPQGQHHDINNNTPPETAVFYKIQITGHYIVRLAVSVQSNNGPQQNVNTTQKAMVNYTIYRRFREFYELYEGLNNDYAALPAFPPKEKFSFFSKLRGSSSGAASSSSNNNNNPTMTKVGNNNSGQQPGSNNSSGDSILLNNNDHTNIPDDELEEFLFKQKRQLQLSTWLQTLILTTPAILHCEDMDTFLCLSDNFICDVSHFPKRLFKTPQLGLGITDFFMCPQYLTMLGEDNDDDNECNLIDQRTGKPIPQPYVTNYINNTNMLYITAQDTALTTKLDSRVNNLFTQGGGSYGCLVPLLYTSKHQHNNHDSTLISYNNGDDNNSDGNDINNTTKPTTTCCFVDLNIPEETSNVKTFFEQDDDDDNKNNDNKNPHLVPNNNQQQKQQQQQQRPDSSDFFHDSTVNILKEPTHPTNQNNNNELNNKNKNDIIEQNKIDVNSLTYTNNLQFIEPTLQFPYFSHRASCLEVLNNVKLTYNIEEQRFILHPQSFEPNPNTGMLTITNTIFVGLDNGAIHVFLHEFNIHANDYFVHQPLSSSSSSNDNNNNNIFIKKNNNYYNSLLKTNSEQLKKIAEVYWHSNRIEKMTLTLLPISNTAQNRINYMLNEIINKQDNQKYGSHIDELSFISSILNNNEINNEYILTLITTSRDGIAFIHDLTNNKHQLVMEGLMATQNSPLGISLYGELSGHYYSLYHSVNRLYITTFKGYILQYYIYYDVKKESIIIITGRSINTYSDTVRKIDLLLSFFTLPSSSSSPSYSSSPSCLIAINNYQNNNVDIWDFEHIKIKYDNVLINNNNNNNSMGNNNNNNNNNSTNNNIINNSNIITQKYPKLLLSIPLLLSQCKVLCIVPLFLSDVLKAKQSKLSSSSPLQSSSSLRLMNGNTIDNNNLEQQQQQQDNNNNKKQTSLYYLFTGHNTGELCCTILNVYNQKYTMIFNIQAHNNNYEITSIKYNIKRNIIITSSIDKTICGWSIPDVSDYIERIL